MKNTTPGHAIIQLLKLSGKEKVLKAARNKTHYVQKDRDKDGSRFLVRNRASEKAVKKHL